MSGFWAGAVLTGIAACKPDTAITTLISPDRNYTVAIKGLHGRALTPFFKHDVTADIMRRDSSDVIHVWLSEEDSLDQTFVTQFSDTEWPGPNILRFKGSQTTQDWFDQLILENAGGSLVRCVKVFTVSNYDVVVAFEISPKARYVIEWKTHQGASKIYFAVARCETPGRTPTVEKTVPRRTEIKEYSYRATFSNSAIELDVQPRKS